MCLSPPHPIWACTCTPSCAGTHTHTHTQRIHRKITNWVDIQENTCTACVCTRTRTHTHTHTHRGSIEKLLTGKIYYKNIHILTNIYNCIQSLVMTSNLSIPHNLSLSRTHQFNVNTHITEYSKKKLTACFHLFCT
jgi:hypothetical protein